MFFILFLEFIDTKVKKIAGYLIKKDALLALTPICI